MDTIRLHPSLRATVGDFVPVLPDEVFTVADTFQKVLHLAKVARHHRDEPTAVVGDSFQVLRGAQLAIRDIDKVLPPKQFPQLLPVGDMGCDIGLVAVVQLVTEGT